jgi:hypothetical protein
MSPIVAAPRFLNLRQPGESRFGDFNNDGFIDIAANIDDGPPVLHNGRTNLRWILIDTIGSSSNHDGIGARTDMVGQ